ncbi:hypothetical protein LYSHEL_18660 [Lysobacter helvus]|uniref:DUF3108 domain-containing protein n=2 Tax=Lysobacteraceae TaxID=32033 RepID=A0ABN6FT07_9GAMM|nr:MULTISPECIES: DUF3108 domain-containing protein [Lysobacter]BCT92842.1 hypothetical protein LYSCAS_18660 [Lysobacter caseinilyticus]BCT95995.1 hypothetical protein LYSHEL_18660 [Lysobacter helvus]
MKRRFRPLPLVLSALLAGVCALAPAVAQVAAPATTATPATTAPAPVVESHALVPFLATYAVFRDGKPLGDATLQLVALDNARWRVDLRIDATHGLIGIAGVNLQQSTLFDVAGTQYRPLTQSSVRKVVFSKKVITGVYDWSAQAAHWTGDLKKTRRTAVALQPGDMSGLLINLAVLRDAVPGTTLHYRFVDEGRARDQQYVVAAQRESQAVDELSYNAMRVDRVRAGGEATTLWVVEGVPSPIRILQQDDDGAIDLRLVDYKES